MNSGDLLTLLYLVTDRSVNNKPPVKAKVLIGLHV